MVTCLHKHTYTHTHTHTHTHGNFVFLHWLRQLLRGGVLTIMGIGFGNKGRSAFAGTTEQGNQGGAPKQKSYSCCDAASLRGSFPHFFVIWRNSLPTWPRHVAIFGFD